MEARLPAELYERQEVEALMDACGRSPTGKRNRALIALLAGCGLRIGEALALEPRDVSTGNGTIRVRNGKGARARTVPLDSTTEALLDAWMKVRPSSARTIICTLKGTPVQTAYVRRMLPRLAKRAAITKRVHAHGLRHYFACSLDRDGYPLATIGAALGHKSAATTAVYLARLRGIDNHTAARLRERSWI